MRWKKAVGWTVAGIFGLAVILVVAAGFIVHTTKFHQYILHVAERQASDKLGVPVTLESFTLSLSTLSLDLYGLRVAGTNGPAFPPVLQADHIAAGIQILSVLHREWRLDHLALDHPVVYLMVDEQGNTNLPTPKSSGSSSNTDIWSLAVQHARLDHGEIYYNDRKSVMAADLHKLTLHAQFDNSSPRYYGALSYADGRLQYDGYDPLPHDLSARFEATPQKFTLTQAVLASGPSRLTLNASMENYNQPHITGNYAAEVASDEFRQAMHNPSLPSGMIHLKGSLDYQSDPNRPFIDTATAAGDISSVLLEVRTPSLRTAIRNFTAHYELANGNAEVRGLHADLLGGALNGGLTMRDLAGNTSSRLNASLRNVSVADLKAMAGPQMKEVRLTGTAGADLEAHWGKTTDNLVAKADVTVQSSVTGSKAPSNAVPTPLNAELHARYVAQGQVLSVDKSYLRTPKTEIDLNGTVSNRSSLQVRVQANDLSELETLADSFQQSPQPLGLAGTLAFSGAVTGSTAKPQINGQLSAANVTVRDTAWKTLRANVVLSPAEAALHNGVLDPAQQGHMTFDVDAKLRNWSFLPDSPVAVTLTANQLQLAQFSKAANLSTPIQGLLSANVSLHGSEQSPEGQGKVSLTKLEVSGQTIKSLDVNFHGTAQSATANLTAQLPIGRATASATYYPQQKSFEAALQAANLDLSGMPMEQGKLPVSGRITLNASGRGTLDNPEAQLQVETTGLKVQDHPIDALKLTGTLQQHVAKVNLDSQVASAYLHLAANVQLTGDYNTDASLDTNNFPLQPLLVAYMPSQAQAISGSTEIHAKVHGPVKKVDLLNAHLEIPTLALQYKVPSTDPAASPQTLEITLATPIRADFANDVLQLQRSEIKGTGTDLVLEGRLPLHGTVSTLNASGSIDMQLLKIVQPDLQSTGQVKFDVRTEGTLASPNLQGTVELANVNIHQADQPIGLENANGEIRVNNDRVQITSFRGTMGGGTLEATGGAVIKPAVSFDVGLKARGIRISYIEGVRAQVTADIGYNGTLDNSMLHGSVQIDSLNFTPDFELASFMNQFAGDVAPPPAESFADNIQMAVSVQTTSNLNLVSRTLSVQGSADLRVAGTAANPVILGRANLTGGDVIFLGNRYVVDGGTLDFVNPVRTSPVVNLQASTTIQQYDINISFRGPADQIQTTYTSNPALPPSDIIHLMTFGSTTEAANAAGPTSTTMGAESLVANQVSSQLTSRVAQVAGISQLSINPNIGGNTTGQQGPSIAVQQRVTSKLYVTFSTDLTSTQQQTVQVQYQVSPKWSASVTRDQNGGFGIDGKYKKSF